jgi:hypothetical protein
MFTIKLATKLVPSPQPPVPDSRFPTLTAYNGNNDGGHEGIYLKSPVDEGFKGSSLPASDV